MRGQCDVDLHGHRHTLVTRPHVYIVDLKASFHRLSVVISCPTKKNASINQHGAAPSLRVGLHKAHTQTLYPAGAAKK